MGKEFLNDREQLKMTKGATVFFSFINQPGIILWALHSAQPK
jgi:hypothetical protein